MLLSLLCVNSQEMNIFYQTASGGESKSPVVVLLHGASSSSQVWNDLKTMHLIAAMGHKAIAVDLPGTVSCTVLYILCMYSPCNKFVCVKYNILSNAYPMYKI